jgi:hypothetical protein
MRKLPLITRCFRSMASAAFAEALSAAEGGAISTAVLYPLEVIKTRLQASSKTPRTPRPTSE